ncbi:hypothetical protein ZWY2020_011878 [Hordeum vulgare]|nr:hypothetical protein ZWY2020_011878 [Hordeum vulgare]
MLEYRSERPLLARGLGAPSETLRAPRDVNHHHHHRAVTSQSSPPPLLSPSTARSSPSPRHSCRFSSQTASVATVTRIPATEQSQENPTSTRKI